MHQLNIVDGSKLPPRLNKPISQMISAPTVATSPVTVEGSLTTPKDTLMERLSTVEGKKKLWQLSDMSPLSYAPSERTPMFIAPLPNSIILTVLYNLC